VDVERHDAAAAGRLRNHIAQLEAEYDELVSERNDLVSEREELAEERERYRRLYLQTLELNEKLERGLRGQSSDSERRTESDAQLILQVLTLYRCDDGAIGFLGDIGRRMTQVFGACSPRIPCETAALRWATTSAVTERA
jgi:chromosome segregation ATPase